MRPGRQFVVLRADATVVDFDFDLFDLAILGVFRRLLFLVQAQNLVQVDTLPPRVRVSLGVLVSSLVFAFAFACVCAWAWAWVLHLDFFLVFGLAWVHDIALVLIHGVGLL